MCGGGLGAGWVYVCGGAGREVHAGTLVPREVQLRPQTPFNPAAARTATPLVLREVQLDRHQRRRERDAQLLPQPRHLLLHRVHAAEVGHRRPEQVLRGGGCRGGEGGGKGGVLTGVEELGPLDRIACPPATTPLPSIPSQEIYAQDTRAGRTHGHTHTTAHDGTTAHGGSPTPLHKTCARGPAGPTSMMAGSSCCSPCALVSAWSSSWVMRCTTVSSCAL